MSENIIEVKKVVKSYNSKNILDQLSLSVPKGSVFGLLGKNGAGKTTLIKCILGLLNVSSGSIEVISDNPHTFKDVTKEKLGYVPQSDRVFPWLSVEQLIAYTASFYKNWNTHLVKKLIKEWEVDKNKKFGTLSEGEAQKVSIILALGHEPELLIFDEPVASLDPSARRDFIKTILKVVADRECTVFFSTHITSDLERIADRVAILKNGKIDYCGELDALKDEVKRLRIVSRQPITQKLHLDGIIHSEISNHEAIISMRGYKSETKGYIEQYLKAEVQVEDLNLEEIFLEFNR